MAFIDALQSLRLFQSGPGSGLAELVEIWRGNLAACLPRRLRHWVLGP